MHARVLLLLLAALAPPLAAEGPETFRVVDEGSLVLTGARAVRGAGANAAAAVVLEYGRGDRLVVRRGPVDGGVQYTVSRGGPPSVTLTRRGDGWVFEAGGRSLALWEADLARPTVRCWVTALVSRADPALLEAADAIRVLKEQTGGAPLDDAFTPVRFLWTARGAGTFQPKGRVRFERGPFAGESWTRLQRLAADELGTK